MLHNESSGYSIAELSRGVPLIARTSPGARARLEFEPGQVERGLMQLVLTVVELIRQLMEKQAMRRIEGGSLTADEIERVGTTLMELEAKVRDLQRQYDIEDLNINLGPLGNLLDE